MADRRFELDEYHRRPLVGEEIEFAVLLVIKVIPLQRLSADIVGMAVEAGGAEVDGDRTTVARA